MRLVWKIQEVSTYFGVAMVIQKVGHFSSSASPEILFVILWERYVGQSISIGRFLFLKRFWSILVKKRLTNFNKFRENEEK